MRSKVDFETDGQLLPLDAMAVRPFSEQDLSELVAQVPRNLAAELARMAAWRALGMSTEMPAKFRI